MEESQDEKMLKVMREAGEKFCEFLNSPEARKVRDQYLNSGPIRPYAGPNWLEGMTADFRTEELSPEEFRRRYPKR